MKSIRPSGRRNGPKSPPAPDDDFADSDISTVGWWWSDGELVPPRTRAEAGDAPAAADSAGAASAEADSAKTDSAEATAAGADPAEAAPVEAATARPASMGEIAPSASDAGGAASEASTPEASTPEASAPDAPSSNTPPADTAPSVDAAPAAPADDPIPMLTEVVQVPRYDTEDLPASLADVDWGDLAERVRENVLERLLRRGDTLLDANLDGTLKPALERAMESLTRELHDAMSRMIRDIVGRAVTEELTRLHAEIARHNRNQNRSTQK